MFPRFPTNSQRIMIVGRTGSGKTVAANYHLSLRNIDQFPWVIIDYKTDKLINSIARAEHVDVGFVPGKKHKGLFIVHPIPELQDNEVNAMLWKLWERENVGVYTDEGYMLTKCPAFNTLLTQGRSKRIPMITLAQRPAWLSRFCFSEADFFQIFDLSDARDEKTVQSFIPYELGTLPDYWSHYYDVGKKELYKFRPVPDESVILQRIEDKLKRNPRRHI